MTAKFSIDSQAVLKGDKPFTTLMMDNARFAVQPFLVGLSWKQQAAFQAGWYLAKKGAAEAEDAAKERLCC